MIRHSNGFSLGATDIHAKTYRREQDHSWLKQNLENYGNNKSQEMVLYDKAAHYISVYEQHNLEVQEFFTRHAPDSFFHGRLNDSELWESLAHWLGLAPTTDINFGIHTHKGKGKFTQAELLVKRNR